MALWSEAQRCDALRREGPVCGGAQPPVVPAEPPSSRSPLVGVAGCRHGLSVPSCLCPSVCPVRKCIPFPQSLLRNCSGWRVPSCGWTSSGLALPWAVPSRLQRAASPTPMVSRRPLPWPGPLDRLRATGPSGSQMQLLETEFSRSVPELIELHLAQQDSIPAFLSSLTLELFSRQTVA
nr:uncharacterized protein LOC103347105 [Oryctolagus cuniculus]